MCTNDKKTQELKNIQNIQIEKVFLHFLNWSIPLMEAFFLTKEKSLTANMIIIVLMKFEKELQ